GEARPGNDLGNGPGATRNQIGRLDHHAVAVGQRWGNLPGGNGNGEVPRRDQADHAQRLARHLDTHAWAHRWQDLARLTQAFAGEELENVPGPRHLADG